MDELINLIIELANYFKYGKINSLRNFKSKLQKCSSLKGDKSKQLEIAIENQLNKLLIDNVGNPSYAYFVEIRNRWYKIFILNSEKQFWCRLKDMQISIEGLPHDFYITL